MQLRRWAAIVAVLGLVTALAPVAGPVTRPVPGRAGPPGDGEYVVLYAAGADVATARAAVSAAGGTVVTDNPAVGYALVRAHDPRFLARATAAAALDGVAPNRVVGCASAAPQAAPAVAGRLTPPVLAAPAAAERGDEPLAPRQWDMRRIGATASGSHAVQHGRRGVVVGVIDTGIDASHPDLAPNLDRARSRNFTTDIPLVDGPCEVPSCKDPVGQDGNGHGSHVASTIAAPINGFGIAGVAPNVTLVDLRAAQDSGLFLLKATLDALTYAADIGVDVVNMSYYVDPWLYNCVANPADTPQQQQEQRTIRRATQRAIDYATRRGVLPVAAAGNENQDLGHPTVDTTSPDYPPGRTKNRKIDNSCIQVPVESDGVVVVSSTGPSGRKAYYSNYGTEQTDLAAPGGDVYDTAGSRLDARHAVLGALPLTVARAERMLNPEGTPRTAFVVRDCRAGRCAYYQYLQGTSMAAPHAAGVAALIVSRHGRGDGGGVRLDAERTRRALLGATTRHACPTPRRVTYSRVRSDGTVQTSSALCAGPPADNGFYGHGIVDAVHAVRR